MRRSPTEIETLKRRKDIDALFSVRTRCRGEGISLIFRSTGLERSRILISVARGAGSAVKRNRIKRQARAILATLKNDLKPGVDIGFIMFPGDFAFVERERSVIQVLNQAGLLIAR